MAILFCFLSCQADQSDQFQGSYAFIAFHQKKENAYQPHPWMQNGTGRLTYDGRGGMSLHMQPPHYQDTSLTKELFDQQYNIQTHSNYVYTGTYTFTKDSLFHHKITHSNPKYAKGSSPKAYKIKGDTLLLYSTIAQKEYRITWLKTKQKR